MKKIIIFGFFIGLASAGYAQKQNSGRAGDPAGRVKSYTPVAGGGAYSVSWLGNTYPDVENYVGNAARSMWVSPGGIVYTASEWDEKGRNIGIYQNGRTIGGMGGTKDSQGSAIGGDSTCIYTAQQRAGYIGRYNRKTRKRDLLFKVSNGTGDAIRGILVNGNEVFVSDFAGNRIGVYSGNGTLLREWKVSKPGAIAFREHPVFERRPAGAAAGPYLPCGRGSRIVPVRRRL